MLYAIISEDVPQSLSLRQTVREDHLARLKELATQNRLVIAGPHPAVDSESPGDEGYTGSLIVAKFKSLTEAQSWADKDPYIAAGVYKHITVKPFKKILP